LVVCGALVGNLAPAAGFSAASGSTDRASIVVSVTPGRRLSTFRPSEAFGATIDGQDAGALDGIYTPSNLAVMESAGLPSLNYGLRTELADQAWHWNPQGSWSDPAHQQGYWTSAATSSVPIETTYGYRLPRRGNTIDQANDDGYSRIDDGDPTTFWKSDPYLDQRFTGEPDELHPQWVVVDLGQSLAVDAVRLSWGFPYATGFTVEYWDGADNPFCPWQSGAEPCPSTPSGATGSQARWRPFPLGTVSGAKGGDGTLRLAPAPLSVRFVRLLMTRSSGQGPPGSTDVRDSVGFALRELYVGTEDTAGRLHDLLRHGAARNGQSLIYVSSTDPWHRATDIDRNTEQPGFDRVLGSGLTNGLPTVVPVAVLFGTPDDAQAELTFLAHRGFPVERVEIGEEPDGQDVLPEDYGALYLEWARALHAVDPHLQLGGPALETGFQEIRVWPDASGETSWLRRFVGYLSQRGASSDFTFLSVEWFPFDDVCLPAAPQLAQEPALLADAFQRWTADGLGAIPKLITEYGYSAFEGESEVDLPGALLNADFLAQFLTQGGTAAYLYGYEPNVLLQNENCNSWGNNMLLQSDDHYQIRHQLATYWAARLLTQTWAEPGDQPHELYPATVHTPAGNAAPVTAFAVFRPDHRWAVLVINKDPSRSYTVNVSFAVSGGAAPVSFSGAVELHQYGPAQYHWSANGPNGQPDRDDPPAVRSLPPGQALSAPAYSLSVLVGSGPPG
jgi:hypothetical protein